MIVWRSWGAWVLILLPLPAWALESPFFLADYFSPETTVQTSQESSSGEDLLKQAALGGNARFDYYSASKKLDNNHSLAGLTFQPRARPKFGTWGDAKIEARIQDEDLSGARANPRDDCSSHTPIYISAQLISGSASRSSPGVGLML